MIIASILSIEGTPDTRRHTAPRLPGDRHPLFRGDQERTDGWLEPLV
jgi:hypothetical protein